MVPCLQLNGKAMVGLKLLIQSESLKVTKALMLTVALLIFAFSAKCIIFVIDHTTKLGMKDLLKAQQRWVEKDSSIGRRL